MEILSPASNMKHIEVAINEKADAVYGGLKKWNARNKAINFTTDEYNQLIEHLHKNKIKFYLTLNILMFDDEIEDVIKFLKNNKLPDAFIVADIGLIKRLQKEFPNIPIHLSTQFGIHNIDDIKYAESINAKRGILARELTLEETTNIRNNTKLELESFIWGSQCLSFSGLCFFGTIINGGGGNRGKCIITCRDIYSIDNNTGHYLYVPDMDCINLSEELKDIECFKIEGRRRKPQEIAKIIKQIKQKENSKTDRGYLFGTTVSQNNLFEQINSRIVGQLNPSDIDKINEEDMFVEFNSNGVPLKFTNDTTKENTKYVFSEIKQQYELNKKNISLDVEQSNGIIKEVLYVNYKGDGHTFVEENKENYIEFDFYKLKEDIEKKDDGINIYKIKYIRNCSGKYEISKDLYFEIINSIVKDCELPKIANFKDNQFVLPSIYVETTDANVIKEIIDDSFVKVIYNISTVQKFMDIKSVIDEYGDRIIYKLPLFNWKSIELNKYYKLLEDKEIMYTRLSQIYKTRNIRFKKKYADYTIYVWNKNSLNYLLENGIDEFTASPELSYTDNFNIYKQNKFQIIMAGYLPMVFTRNCFKSLYGCTNCLMSQKNQKDITNKDKKMNYKIICEHDYRMIINETPILNDLSNVDIKNANVSFRYVTLGQDLETIKDTINILKGKNYYTNLRKIDAWNKSYECNLFQSRD